MSHELLLHSKMKMDTPTTFPHSEDSCEKVVIVYLSLGCEQINGGCYNFGQIRASPESVSDHEHPFTYSPVQSKDTNTAIVI